MKLSRALHITKHSTIVIITTTSHFDKKDAALANWHIIWEDDLPSPELTSRLKAGLTLVSRGVEGAYYRGISTPQMESLRALTVGLNIPLLVADQTNNYTVRQPIAAIILAAGEAARFGSPKQLLDYHGQPFVRQVAQTALNAGLSPVIVVSGASAERVETSIQDLPITIIRNQAWRDGQSSSIRAGIASITGTNVGGAVLLVADQPQVTVHVIGALVERHAAEGTAIVAPLAADRRTNPILFARDTFTDLLALTGDVGGRAIFSNYQVDYIPWHDESLLFDVDTPDDYRKLLAWGVED